MGTERKRGGPTTLHSHLEKEPGNNIKMLCWCRTTEQMFVNSSHKATPATELRSNALYAETAGKSPLPNSQAIVKQERNASLLFALLDDDDQEATEGSNIWVPPLPPHPPKAQALPVTVVKLQGREAQNTKNTITQRMNKATNQEHMKPARIQIIAGKQHRQQHKNPTSYNTRQYRTKFMMQDVSSAIFPCAETPRTPAPIPQNLRTSHRPPLP